MHDRAEILAFGRDPDQPSFWQVHRRLRAAGLAIALISAAVTAGVLTSQPTPGTAPRLARPMAAMLSGVPFRPARGLGVLILGGPGGVRVLKVSDQVPGAAGSAQVLPIVTASSVPGPSATVMEIASVFGGVVALLSNATHTGPAPVGDAFFIPVTQRGAGVPRLIARANYVAVAPGQRDIWVEQLAVPPGNDGRAWLVDESGYRRSAVVRLRSHMLLAATADGLLVQGPSGEGASLISPTTGVIRPAGIPADALVVAVDANHVAWQAASCAGACSLRITSLRDGTDAAIPLPPRTLPDAYSPLLAAFSPGGQRLALAMDTTNREDRITTTWAYVVNIGTRRLIRLPGGPIPLSEILTRTGTALAGSPGVVSVHWAGSRLWIVATSGEYSQAGYWTGVGPLRVLAPMRAPVSTFNVVAADRGT